MIPENSCIVGSKGQGLNVSIGFQTKRNTAVAVYGSHTGFLPAWLFALVSASFF